MTTNLTVPFSYNNEQISIIKKTVAEDANDYELKMFIEQCKRTALDPFSRQIYFMKNSSGKVSIMTSIDGLRLIAQRSGDYQGQTKVEWCSKDGTWRDIYLDETPPVAARVGVHKKGFIEPLYAVALFKEYAVIGKNGLSPMWKNKPVLMLAKVAEALALRKAFPNEMSGLYTNDEMNQEQEEKVKETAWNFVIPTGEFAGKLLCEMDDKYLDNLLNKPSRIDPYIHEILKSRMINNTINVETTGE